jgi:hypothetical protein
MKKIDVVLASTVGLSFGANPARANVMGKEIIDSSDTSPWGSVRLAMNLGVKFYVNRVRACEVDF